MNEYSTYNFHIRGYKDIHTLQNTLNYKVENISEKEKEILGYYYLSNLMDKIPNMRFNNYSDFHYKLEKIIEEFPISNNGYTKHNPYLIHFEKFRKEVQQELGLIQKNYIIIARSLQSFITSIILGIIVYLIYNNITYAIISCCILIILGTISGIYTEQQLEKSNRILYNKK